MMKKTTSALAVAAMMGTGAASAATFQVNENTSLSISGDLQFAYYDVETRNFELDANDDVVAEDDKNFQSIEDNGTSLVFSGESTLENGMTTFFNLDLDGFNATDADSAVQNSGSGFNEGGMTDEGHIGIRGNFGDIRFGSDSAVYNAVDGKFDYMDTLNPTSFGRTHTDRALQYRSNDFNGVSFALEAQINPDAQKSDGGSTSLAASVTADLGMVTLNAAYDQRENDAPADVYTTVRDRNNNDITTAYGSDPSTQGEALYGLVATFDLAPVTVDVGYQKSGNQVETYEADLMSLGVKYNYGQGSLYGVYQQTSFDGTPYGVYDTNTAGTVAYAELQDDDTFNEIALGANYNVTDNMYVYAEYFQFDAVDDRGDTIATGVYYGW